MPAQRERSGWVRVISQGLVAPAAANAAKGGHAEIDSQSRLHRIEVLIRRSSPTSPHRPCPVEHLSHRDVAARAAVLSVVLEGHQVRGRPEIVSSGVDGSSFPSRFATKRS